MPVDNGKEIVEPLFRDIRENQIDLDVDMVRRAFELALDAHQDQKRRSGEPYVTHPVAVARILVHLLEKRADAVILSAALLHDVVEDTGSQLADIRREFGDDVATLVDGVTKIEGLQFSSTEAEQVENFRKMLLSMAEDIRVILIKLADRLHNMRTLDHLAPDRQQAIALETREIYAPLAHRLGIGRVKWEMEDLALKYLDNAAYRELAGLISGKRHEREEIVNEVIAPISEALAAGGIQAEIKGRPKHFDSIYRKMKRQRTKFDAIYDLIGVRIITGSKADCYQTLGILHELYKPVPDRFKDYIATPKSNLYQSLHTTVIGPGGRVVEVQIRTEEMHRLAEYGIAAHYSYKEGSRPEGELDEKLGGLVGGTLEWGDGTDPHEYMDFLKDVALPGRGLRVHAQGRSPAVAQGRHRPRLRLSDPHRGRSPLRGGPGQRSSCSPALQAEERRHGGGGHPAVGAPLGELARSSQDLQGQGQGPPLGQGAAPGGQHRARSRDAGPGAQATPASGPERASSGQRGPELWGRVRRGTPGFSGPGRHLRDLGGDASLPRAPDRDQTQEVPLRPAQGNGSPRPGRDPCGRGGEHDGASLQVLPARCPATRSRVW